MSAPIDMDFDLVAKEPFRAILLHSPGRKPWVNHWNTFFEPRRGGTSETDVRQMLTL